MQAIILTTIMMVVYTKLPLCDLSDEISMSARQDYSVMSLPFGFIFVMMILIDKFNFKWFKWQLPLFLPIVFTTYLYCSSSQSSPSEQLNSALYSIVVIFPWMMYDKGIDYQNVCVIISTNMVYRLMYFNATKAVVDSTLAVLLIRPDALFIPIYVMSLLILYRHRHSLFLFGFTIRSALPVLLLSTSSIDMNSYVNLKLPWMLFGVYATLHLGYMYTPSSTPRSFRASGRSSYSPPNHSQHHWFYFIGVCLSFSCLMLSFIATSKYTYVTFLDGRLPVMFLFDGCLTFPAVFSSLLVAARKSDNSPRDFDDLLTSKSTDLSLGPWFWMGFVSLPIFMGYLLVQSVVVICSYAIGGQRSHYDMLWWGCLVYFNILYWLFYLEITNRTTKDYLRWLFVKQQRDIIKQGYSNAQCT
jgi:hypothetical protein